MDLTVGGFLTLKVWIDGSSKGNPGPARASIVFEDGEKATKDLGATTNNRAEYEALILALRTAIKRGIDSLTVLTDSQLIDGHINKGWKVNENQDLVSESRVLLRNFKHSEVLWVSREKNRAHID
jgi:ribonuclease HI